MLTQDSGKKKVYKMLLDILVTIAIVSFINLLLGLFGIQIPIIKYVGIPLVFALIFFLLMIKFGKITKKWGWIFLESLIIIGPIIKVIVGMIYMNTLAKSGEIFNLLKGSVLSNVPIGIQILDYIGSLLFLIGFLSAILFYFIYYRKYLSGALTLQELGVQGATDEKKFTQQWQEKEKKQNKIGIIILIILILIFVGVLIYLALM